MRMGLDAGLGVGNSSPEINENASEARLRLLLANSPEITDSVQLGEFVRSLFSEKFPEDAIFRFLRSHKDKIRGHSELGCILSRIANFESRLVFARENQEVIGDGNQLAEVICRLSFERRLIFAIENKDKIQAESQLGNVLDCLRDDDKLTFARKSQDKIKGGYGLAIVLSHLPRKHYLFFAKEYQYKIQNADQLGEVLSCLSEKDRLAFALVNHDKIKSIKDFDKVVAGIGRYSVSPTFDEKCRLAEACCPTVRMEYFFREKVYVQRLFSDPVIQQLIALKKVDANAFLFAAASNPSSDSDFEFFLTHPLCSVEALNERAQDLTLAIEGEKTLSSEIRIRRLARIKELQEVNRRRLSQQNIGFDLSSVKETEFKFEGDLPVVDSTTNWTIADVKPEHITRFRQLIQWLKSQAILEAFQDNFSYLDTNESIRTSLLFGLVAKELESFLAALSLYLKKLPKVTTLAEQARQASALAPYLDACNQFDACAAGVVTALQGMTRSLNPDVSIADVVRTAVDQGNIYFINSAGIEEGNEVHTSTDLQLRLLGFDTPYHYDSYRLPISLVYLKAMARDAAGRLTPDYLISQSLPSLASLKKGPCLTLDAELASVLQQDWSLLFAAGLLTVDREGVFDKLCDVIQFITSEMLDAAIIKDIVTRWSEGDNTQEFTRELSEEELTIRYRALLERRGILTRSAQEMDVIKKGIWRFLTAANFTSTLNNFLVILLKSSNGLSLIKEVIESHSSEEQRQIRLDRLLHCPTGSSMNIFRSLATDLYFVGWMMGFEFKRIDGFLYLENTTTPLAHALGSNALLMEKEFQEVFILSGNLFFWLAGLWGSEGSDCIFDYIDEKNLYQFDSSLAVLGEMISDGDDLQRATAQYYLEEYCERQKQLGLWHCYWKMASCIPNFDLAFDSRDMLLSLKDPVNARAAVFIAGSNQKLALKITRSLVTIEPILKADLAVVFATIQGLYSRSAVESSVVAPVVRELEAPRASISMRR